MLSRTIARENMRCLFSQSRGMMAVSRPRSAAWMSVSIHGESVPYKWRDFRDNKNAICVNDAPDLATWRKQMEEAGTPDPFWMLTPEERNAWVDDAENRHFNPTMTTPSGFRYGPKYPYYGAYGIPYKGNFPRLPWVHPSIPGFEACSVRTALICHPEILKRESIGLIWVLVVCVLWNNYYWKWELAATANKDYWLSQAASDTGPGMNFGRKVSMTE